MRALRREIASQAFVFALPAAILAVFPYDAVRFRASDAPAGRGASAAFVVLSDKAEAEALVSAKTAWQSDAPAGRRMRRDLALGDLPEPPSAPLLEFDASSALGPAFPPVSYGVPAWCPTGAAARPEKIGREPARPRDAAFPRDELLRDAFQTTERKVVQ